MNTIRQWWETICRMCWWGWKLRNSYDWDYGYLDEMLYLKLDRMQKNMSKYGNCLWNSDPKAKEYWLMRKLEQAVYTAKIINNENEEPIYKQQLLEHERIYGEMLLDLGASGLGFSKCTSKEQGKIAWEAYNNIHNEHAERIKQYRKHFHILLYKYGRQWWD